MTGLRKRLLQGLGANVFGQVANVTIQLVSVPIFLRMWGVGLYGEWLILSTIPAYFAMSDMGFANVAANEMAMTVSKGDRVAALEVFQSTCALISGICFFVLLCVLSIIGFAPFELWLNIQQQTHLEVVSIIALLTTYVLVKLQGGMLTAGFRSEGNYAVGTFLGSVIRLFENLAVAVVALLGGSLVMAAATFLLVQICGLFAMKYELGRRSPWIVYGTKQIRLSTIKRLATPAFAFMGFPLGYALNNQGIVTVVAVVLGPPAVAVFSTLRTLSRLAFQLMNMVNNTVWPEVSAAYGANNLALARKLHHYSCRVSIWGAALSVMVLFIFGDFIVDNWTQGKIDMNYSVFYVMLAIILFNSLWLTSSVVPLATNQHQKTAICFLIGTSLSVLSAIFLTQQFGLTGTAIAALFSDLLMTCYVLKTSLTLLQDDFLSFCQIMFRPPSLKALWRG